jgi:hypothetical protein
MSAIPEAAGGQLRLAIKAAAGREISSSFSLEKAW